MSAPTLPAYLSPGGSQWWVYCESEQRFHFHGIGEGHRVAHCVDPRSPYNQTGYHLRYAGRWEDLPHEVRHPRRRRGKVPS